MDTSANIVDAPKVVENWKYSQEEDKMTDKVMYFAQNTSTNLLQFEFPYNGGAAGAIIVRNMNGSNDVVLAVDKGQFMTSISNDEYIRVRFDGGEAVKYIYSSSSDGSSNMVFIDNGIELIKRLKNCKAAMIDAPFYDAGRQVMEFNVEGLKWEH